MKLYKKENEEFKKTKIEYGGDREENRSLVNNKNSCNVLSDDR